MSMDAELYSRVRKLEKQVEALMERHPEVRAVLQRDALAVMNIKSEHEACRAIPSTFCYADNELRLITLQMDNDGIVQATSPGPFSATMRQRITDDCNAYNLVPFQYREWRGTAFIKGYEFEHGQGYLWNDLRLTLKPTDDWKPLFRLFSSDAP